MHQRQLSLFADGAFLRRIVGEVQLGGAGQDGNGRGRVRFGAVHHAHDAQAFAAGLLDDALRLQRRHARGHHILGDDTLFARPDGKALERHHIVHTLGEDSAFARLAGQLVGVNDAAHGRTDDDVHVQFPQLFGHGLHGRGAFFGVLLQIRHLAVGRGMAAGGQQEVALQKRVAGLQYFKHIVHVDSPFYSNQICVFSA